MKVNLDIKNKKGSLEADVEKLVEIFRKCQDRIDDKLNDYKGLIEQVLGEVD